jgi:hypothetical protein
MIISGTLDNSPTPVEYSSIIARPVGDYCAGKRKMPVERCRTTNLIRPCRGCADHIEQDRRLSNRDYRRVRPHPKLDSRPTLQHHSVVVANGLTSGVR